MGRYINQLEVNAILCKYIRKTNKLEKMLNRYNQYVSNLGTLYDYLLAGKSFPFTKAEISKNLNRLDWYILPIKNENELIDIKHGRYFYPPISRYCFDEATINYDKKKRKK